MPNTPTNTGASDNGSLLEPIARFVTPDGACEGASIVGMVHHTTLSIWNAMRKTLALGVSTVPLTASAVLTPTSKVLLGLPYLFFTKISRLLHDGGESMYKGVAGSTAA